MFQEVGTRLKVVLLMEKHAFYDFSSKASSILWVVIVPFSRQAIECFLIKYEI